MNDIVMLERLEHGTIDLTKPSLPALSYILRHPEMWPSGFEWNFSECKTCAIGLYWRLWPSSPMRAEEGIDLGRVFLSGSYVPTPSWRVTPEMVADRIDSLLGI